MSRVGRLPISLPQGVTVDIQGSEVTVKGPKGELYRSFHPAISIALKDGNIVVSRPSDQNVYRALHGLTRSLLANMVEGVDKGFEKVLDVVGVGYRAQKSGDKLVFQVGYTHPVEISPPIGISLATEGVNRIRVSGIDKELVGEVAAQIRAVRPPDSYKGKGIRYSGEKVRLKPGKAGKTIGKK
ncbi:MAG TPA: 50S ribosomal protein L6 [Dehalococcoidia bacterium]|nr:50S ribosomal protein L6 [Dehalococcoidia bacterium]